MGRRFLKGTVLLAFASRCTFWWGGRNSRRGRGSLRQQALYRTDRLLCQRHGKSSPFCPRSAGGGFQAWGVQTRQARLKTEGRCVQARSHPGEECFLLPLNRQMKLCGGENGRVLRLQEVSFYLSALRSIRHLWFQSLLQRSFQAELRAGALQACFCPSQVRLSL